MAAIFGKRKTFFKLPRVHCLDTLWVDNFYKIAHFCVLPIWAKIQNGRHFWGGENFFTIAKSTLLRYSVGRKFRRNRSISHGFGDRSKSVFCHFWPKFENSKWLPFFGERKICLQLPRVHCSDILWIKNFEEIDLLRTFKEIEANLCFAIFDKNSKIQNGRHFWGGENFLKIATSTFLRYPVR